MNSIKLMPANHSIEKLKADYNIMKAMIYGEYPTFDEILKRIQELEVLIHGVEMI